MIGKTILHYKILEKLGEGGMGVVYKAEDTKLDRIVALKFLPQHITTNESDKARFLHEAKAASAINHPNVCVIYDIQEFDEQQFIVMEYVDGETLGQKIKSGQMPLKSVTSYAMQIAEALQEAHSNGIIHRDIKSENIMVNSKNQIKVMDFGLAKLKGSLKLTKTTSTAGTLSYMAPEQIQGGDIDARSDIFSFGVVLYEMLTSHLPFRGDYESAMMYSILNEEPESIQKYRSDLSSEYMHILNRSLEKDPEDRYQNAHDIAIDLKRVLRDSDRVSRKSIPQIPNQDSDTDDKSVEHQSKQKSKLIIVGAVLSTLVLVILALLFFKLPNKKITGPMKTTRFTSYPGAEISPAFSPDGNQIAFVWDGENGDNYDIYVKQLGVGEYQAHRITKNMRADWAPVWTPDGRHLIFSRDESLVPNKSGRFGSKGIYRIPVLGGSERRLTSGSQPDCSPDGNTIVLIDHVSDSTKDELQYGLFFYSLDNNLRKQFSNPPPGNSDTFPKISPNSKKIAFLRSSGENRGTIPGEIFIIPITGGKEVQITFDSTHIAGLSWTPDSKNIIFSSNRSGTHNLWIVSDKGGEPLPVNASGLDIRDPDISPDGYRIAFSEVFFGSEIVRYDLSRFDNQNLLPEKFNYSGNGDGHPSYSPNGEKIVFASNRTGSREIWICDKNGQNSFQVTHLAPAFSSVPQWAPDNKTIVFHSNRDICTIHSDGSNFKHLTNVLFDDQNATFSKDGNWIYFESNRNRSGIWNIWKISAQGGNAVQLTSDGAFRPQESPDGKWIYYYNQIDGREYVAKIPVIGGKEIKVFQWREGSFLLFGNTAKNSWTIVHDGIYFQNYDENGQGVLKFYEFATETIKTVVNLREPYYAINMSPDKHFLLCARNSSESNIMMVENWR